MERKVHCDSKRNKSGITEKEYLIISLKYLSKRRLLKKEREVRRKVSRYNDKSIVFELVRKLTGYNSYNDSDWSDTIIFYNW